MLHIMRIAVACRLTLTSVCQSFLAGRPAAGMPSVIKLVKGHAMANEGVRLGIVYNAGQKEAKQREDWVTTPKGRDDIS